MLNHQLKQIPLAPGFNLWGKVHDMIFRSSQIKLLGMVLNHPLKHMALAPDPDLWGFMTPELCWEINNFFVRIFLPIIGPYDFLTFE